MLGPGQQLEWPKFGRMTKCLRAQNSHVTCNDSRYLDLYYIFICWNRFCCCIGNICCWDFYSASNFLLEYMNFAGTPHDSVFPLVATNDSRLSWPSPERPAPPWSSLHASWWRRKEGLGFGFSTFQVKPDKSSPNVPLYPCTFKAYPL
jgi:hypothetical protein